MALATATRIGPYEVIAQIGAGGMGEVYRARDAKLNRDVALKILPEAFTLDGDRIARFRREAQVLASLNHPNIAQIYGFEDSGSTHALVLELVEGPTLADRIAKGPILLDEALPIAKQIAEALEAAHEQGIIHRDLKPANIKLRDDGTVKVLDFGLAKAMEPVSSINPTLSVSPTITTPAQMTGVGMILGTAAYMSPEQAKGRPADKRSDVWAFGCVLYEMLTGKRAFDGEDVSDTLATVLKSEPVWNALPSGTPVVMRTILQGCLDKARKSRMPDISVVRYLLDGGIVPPASSSAVNGTATGRRTVVVWRLTAALLTVAMVAGAAGVYLRRSPVPVITRFFVVAPDKQTFRTGQSVAASAVISPDGRRLAFTAQDPAGKTALWVRPMDSLIAQPLVGTADAQFPFWSPDSRFIGFFAAGRLLKIDVGGGPPQTICTCDGRSASWSRAGTIAMAGGFGSGLLSVSAAGGVPTPLTRLAANDRTHQAPFFLPDSRHLLYYSVTTSSPLNGLYMFSLETGESKRLIASTTGGIYDPASRSLLFVREGTLLAQPFSEKTLTVSDEAVPIAEHVESGTLGFAGFSVSETGTLVYGVGSLGAAGLQMVWVDRQGKVIEPAGPEGNYRGLDLAVDGKRIAAHRHDGDGGDVWITDLARGTTSRFTFDASQDNSSPIWSPDGTRVAFGALRGGKWGLYVKTEDGAGGDERLIESDIQILPMSWTPDGRSVVYQVNKPNSGRDVFSVEVSGDRKPVPVLNSPFNQSHPQVSPDGKWVAYHSNETSRNEIYVRPFPSGAGKWQVSAGGGEFARWRSDGRELFYMSANTRGKMMAVNVRSGGSRFASDAPRALFDTGYVNLPHTGNYHTYAVSRDGQRFLIPRPPASAVADAAPLVAVVLNWAAAIEKK